MMKGRFQNWRDKNQTAKSYRNYLNKSISVSEKSLVLPVSNHPGRLLFYCPGCKSTHTINIDPSIKWPCHKFSGTFDNPTIRASILVDDHRSYRCHSFITEGNIEFLFDCSHNLAGTTVPLQPL